MPKMKTNRSAAKRFKRTKSGGLKRSMAFGRHLKTGKSPKRKRSLRKAVMLDKSEIRRINKMLPYG